MRILIADNVVDSQFLAKLATFGRVDIVQNGRDAVIAYVNTAAIACFYDLIVLNQNMGVQDGFKTVEMIRMYESEHRESGKQTTICIISSDEGYSQHLKTVCGNDMRTHILGTPVNLDLLESLASSVSAETALKKCSPFVPVRMRRSVNVKA